MVNFFIRGAAAVAGAADALQRTYKIRNINSLIYCHKAKMGTKLTIRLSIMQKQHYAPYSSVG